MVLETIQGGAGFIVPKPNYLKAVKARCEEVGAIPLILDEIQPGIGRTGTLFAYEQEGIIPDILVIGKGLGGGLPIGAFCGYLRIWNNSQNPALGHITTFGGNPVIAAAFLTTLSTILTKKIVSRLTKKNNCFRSLLKHPKIEEIRSQRNSYSPHLVPDSSLAKVVQRCSEKGLILFFLLWEKRALQFLLP